MLWKLLALRSDRLKTLRKEWRSDLLNDCAPLPSEYLVIIIWIKLLFAFFPCVILIMSLLVHILENTYSEWG